MRKIYDIVIIGGGFYGCMIARELKKNSNSVIVIEKESELLTKASYNNQARVHNGYHYPRSFLTAYRSHENYSRFIKDFSYAIDDKVTMVYAIAKATSKVTSDQFERFAKQINSPLSKAPNRISKLFNDAFIEKVFVVDEKVFNAAKMRSQFNKDFRKLGIDVLCKSRVESIQKTKHLIDLKMNEKRIKARRVFVCAYSSLNEILRSSNLPLLPFKHEWTEMPLVKAPREINNIGITIMDGPFFGVVPFPDRNLHSLHHVRYTPFQTFFHEKDKELKKRDSQFEYMKKDASRYVPCLRNMEYKDSLYEIRTVLTQNEADDGRPILYRKDYGIKGLYVVMGGKIDNIYDVLQRINS